MDCVKHRLCVSMMEGMVIHLYLVELAVGVWYVVIFV